MRIGTDQATEMEMASKHGSKYADIVLKGGVVVNAVPKIKLALSMTAEVSSIVDKNSEEISPKECELVASEVNKKLELVNTAFKNLSAALAEHDIDIVSKRFTLDDMLIITKERHARVEYKG